MQIRPARPDDAVAVVALRAAVFPYLVRGVASTRRMIAEPPPGADWIAYVAEVDARPVGWVSAFRNVTTSEPDVGELSTLHVHPDHRGRGIGGALFTAGWRHLTGLGTRRVCAMAPEQGLDFARRRGFEPSREARYAALHPDPARPVPSAPDGVRLTAMAQLEPRQLYDADVAAAADEPGDVPVDKIGFDTWRYEVWDNIGLDREASTAAVLDGKVVAFSLVKRDGERMWSDFTGTVPGFRGRGLAYLVKAAALRRAAADGVTVAYTCNDGTNAPMLAVNTRLGYRPVATQFSCVAALD